MKKFILIAVSMIVMFAADVKAQDVVMRDNSYGYYWGTAADTLIASDTLALVIRVQGATTRDLNFGLQMTKVSGTVTNDFIFAGSMDNVTYTNLDTIAHSNASTTLTEMRLDNFNYPYLRVRSISGATTQKASYKLWYINRND